MTGHQLQPEEFIYSINIQYFVPFGCPPTDVHVLLSLSFLFFYMFCFVFSLVCLVKLWLPASCTAGVSPCLFLPILPLSVYLFLSSSSPTPAPPSRPLPCLLPSHLDHLNLHENPASSPACLSHSSAAAPPPTHTRTHTHTLYFSFDSCFSCFHK